MTDALAKQSASGNYELMTWFWQFFLQVTYICYDHHGDFQVSSFFEVKVDILISLIFKGYRVYVLKK